MSGYFTKKVIIHQSSYPNTPQQNGISKRKNRHLLETAQSLIFTTNVPKQFWRDAILAATYLISRLPSQVLNYQTRLDHLLYIFPHIQTLTSIPKTVFGCTVFVHNYSVNKSKLDPRVIKCMFLGYSPTQKGYCCYSPITKKFYTSLDVTFFESRPYYQKSLQEETSSEANF